MDGDDAGESPSMDVFRQRHLDNTRGGEVYKVILGDLMRVYRRKLFRVQKGSPDAFRYTGTIGFMEYTVGKKSVPHRTRTGRFTTRSYDTKRVMNLDRIVVEPSEQGTGYGKHLVKHLEKAARQLGVDTIIVGSKENPIISASLEHILKKEGYQTVWYRTIGVKYVG